MRMTFKQALAITSCCVGAMGVVQAAAAQGYRSSDYSDSFRERFNTTYISVNAGINDTDENDFNFSASTPVETDYDTGWAISGEVGYNVGPYAFIDNVKLGVEAAYLQNDVDTHIAGGNTLTNAEGELGVTSLMANMYHEYDTGNAIVPYYGLGIGLANVDADNYRTTQTGTALNDDDTAFMYQGTAGVNFILSDATDIGARYRYAATAGAELTGDGPGASAEDFDYQSHLFTVNLTYNF